ncbi:MAG: beta-ketoacyl synthase N-terminal-like domain-containing protein [Verrucomicrobiales bacterium]|nr:beta-ketoacyl synthase N-terminal-like domain-containing protein [Verrucomicrobiales bacterium]
MSENRTNSKAPDPIAIIGMSLRVPGANSPEQLWENFLSGTDSITHFQKEDLDFPMDYDQEG